MAAKAGFKQECPHCEASVPIKDEKLVGEEIKCPKCKQPFVVEEPGDSSNAAVKIPDGKKKKKGGKESSGQERIFQDDEPGAEKQKGKAKAKGPDLKSTKMILGIGLAAVTIILLVVAYFLMGGKKQPPAPTFAAAGSGPANTQRSQPHRKKEKAEEEKRAADTAAEPAQRTPSGNPSNLLPNDTEIVLDLHVHEDLKNPLGRMLFDADGATRANWFEARYGFPLEDVERWIAAGRYTQEWIYEIIRTSKAVSQAAVVKALGLQPAESAVQGQDYFVTPYNWMEAGSPIRYLDRNAASTETAVPGSRPLAVRFADAQTIVLGDLAPVQDFLRAKGQFPRKPAPRGAAAGSGSWMTINPRLRSALDTLEAKPPVMMAFAIDLDTDRKVDLGPKDLSLADNASIVALAVQVKEVINLTGLIEGKTDDYAEVLRGELSQLLKKATAVASLMGIGVKFTETKRPQAGAAPRPGAADEDPETAGRGRRRQPPPTPSGPTTTTTTGTGKEKASAAIQLTLTGKLVEAQAELKLDQDTYERLVRGMEPYLVRGQSELVMTLARVNTQDLAGALTNYAAGAKQFPWGTARRPPSVARANRPWPPDRRVSWMAEMLPYLGFSTLYQHIKPQRSWQDPENLTPSVTVIPAFLDPANPHSSWYVRYPGMDYDVAATHFVGIAGIGLDAAEYSASDRTVAAKLGIFGYDRYTRLSDITDGLSNTIALAEVPPIYKCPWIAGGGSTIRGVPETRSIAPFVSSTYEGKRGTSVLMADGSVRFLSENTSDEVFKALCTIKGGEPKLNIEKIAPRVKPILEQETPVKAQ